MPIPQIDFDGLSDPRPDPRLTRESIAALTATLPHEADHGWREHIEVLIVLYWRAHAGSYTVIKSAGQYLPTSGQDVGAKFSLLACSPFSVTVLIRVLKNSPFYV